MKINNLPLGRMVDENGHITKEWRVYHEQFTNQVQRFLSDERYLFPKQPDPRRDSPEIKGLDTQDNLGGSYYHPISNNLKVNLEKYSASDSSTQYEFVPHLTYHEVTSIDDRNAIPTEKSQGKIVVVPTDPTKFYIFIDNAWRTGTLTT